MTASLVTHRDPVGDDRGSIMLLALGYAILALVAVFICVDITSLYLAQKRLDALADAAALAGADGFVVEVIDGAPETLLLAEDVRSQATNLLDAVAEDTQLLDADAPDGASARVRIGTRWQPPIFTFFVPEGVDLESTATSRTVLR